jgi:integrase
MSRNPNRGRVYRRCGCRDANGTQLGARCPQLTHRRHGTWAFAVDLPTLDHARRALDRVLVCERAAIHIDDRPDRRRLPRSLARDQTAIVKPTTLARYLDYIRKDMTPALGAIRLEELTHHHVASFVTIQLAAGRGPVTVHRCIATLSSALTDAVRHHRLIRNPARFANIPRPRPWQQTCWSPLQAAAFLRHSANVGDPLAELYELIMCTGMRKGEALALHCADVDLDNRVLFVRYTLSNINNTAPTFTAPKTRSSHAWIGLSERAANALRRQANRQHDQRLTTGPNFRDHELVFTRRNGQPLRHEYVLRHLRQLAHHADLPLIRVHDLLHFAATTMLSSQVTLAMASKTMRHSTISTTTEIYSHLLRHTAHQAVDAIDTAITAAHHAGRMTTTLRPHREKITICCAQSELRYTTHIALTCENDR